MPPPRDSAGFRERAGGDPKRAARTPPKPLHNAGSRQSRLIHLIVHVVAVQVRVNGLVALRDEVERPHRRERAKHHPAQRGIVDPEGEPSAVTVQAVVDQRKGGRGGQEGRGGGGGERGLLRGLLDLRLERCGRRRCDE